MKHPHESYWKESKIIHWYIHGIVQFEIHYSTRETLLLVGFIDFDWASDPNDQKSTVSYVFTLCLGPITWDCKKQSAIALSSTKAKYRAIVQASKEAMWIQQILS